MLTTLYYSIPLMYCTILILLYYTPILYFTIYNTILHYTTLHFTTIACRGTTHYIVQQILQYNVVLPVYGEHF